ERQHADQGHAETGSPIRRQSQIAPPKNRGLIEQLHILRGNRRSEVREQFDRVQFIAFEVRHQLLEGHALEQRGELLEQLRIVARALIERIGILVQRPGFTGCQQLRQLHDLVAPHGAEHRTRVGLERLAIAVRQQLIEQRQRITQAAVAAMREQLYRRWLELNVLRPQNLLQSRTDQGHRQSLEIELQAAREHRDRQLLRVGSREQELHMRRRLLERLEQRVE